MLFKFLLAPICYVILSSALLACSGQNLKGGTGGQVGQDQQAAPKDVAKNDKPTTADEYKVPATVPKEVAGSFLAQCEALSATSYDVGCNLYEVDQSFNTALYTGSYTSALVAGNHRVLGKTATHGKFQKTYHIESVEQLNALSDANVARIEVWTGVSGTDAVRGRVAISKFKVEQVGDPCKDAGEKFSANELLKEYQSRQTQSKIIVTSPVEKDKDGKTTALLINKAKLKTYLCFQSPIFKFVFSVNDVSKLVSINGEPGVDIPNCEIESALRANFSGPISCRLYSMKYFADKGEMDSVKLEFTPGITVPKYSMYVTSNNYSDEFCKQEDIPTLACGLFMLPVTSLWSRVSKSFFTE